MKLVINDRIFQEINGLQVGVVIVKDVNNSRKIDLSREYQIEKARIKEKFADIELPEYPVIRKWRDIYKSFGEKKARSSVESLIRRILNDKEPSSINPLVDIYNLISLKYEMPCGGENLDTIDGNIELTYANGNEMFIPLGETASENPNLGEIIYKSGDTVMCRNFNYRESDLTKLTPDTKNAILVIENIGVDNLSAALNNLAKMIQEKLGGTAEIKILDSENSSVILDE